MSKENPKEQKALGAKVRGFDHEIWDKCKERIVEREETCTSLRIKEHRKLHASYWTLAQENWLRYGNIRRDEYG